jgi:hypothetical protein
MTYHWYPFYWMSLRANPSLGNRAVSAEFKIDRNPDIDENIYSVSRPAGIKNIAFVYVNDNDVPVFSTFVEDVPLLLVLYRPFVWFLDFVADLLDAIGLVRCVVNDG